MWGRRAMAEINGVEIFSEGKWNGNVITSETLKQIVAGFKETNGTVKPVLKLGHSDDQAIFKTEGMPAAGWVSNVYIKGKKLLADFVDIPSKIYDLILKKAYRKVSVEIWQGLQLNGKEYNNVLGAVALLGADTPAVMNLRDILDSYKDYVKSFTANCDTNTIDLKVFHYEMEGGSEMADNKENEDIKALRSLTESLQVEVKAFQSQLSAVKAEKTKIETEFKTHKDGYDKKISELEDAKAKAEIEKFTSDLKSRNLLAPSMVPYAKALIEAGHKHTYSVGDKKLSVAEAIENLLGLAKEAYKINLVENTVDGDKDKKDSVKKIEEEIEKEMADSKVSYRQAYTAVLKRNGGKGHV